MSLCPVCFEGVSGFLQGIGLCCVDDVYRGSKYFCVVFAEVKEYVILICILMFA
jgi:hypothetical protein